MQNSTLLLSIVALLLCAGTASADDKNNQLIEAGDRALEVGECEKALAAYDAVDAETKRTPFHASLRANALGCLVTEASLTEAIGIYKELRMRPGLPPEARAAIDDNIKGLEAQLPAARAKATQRAADKALLDEANALLDQNKCVEALHPTWKLSAEGQRSIRYTWLVVRVPLCHKSYERAVTRLERAVKEFPTSVTLQKALADARAQQAARVTADQEHATWLKDREARGQALLFHEPLEKSDIAAFERMKAHLDAKRCDDAFGELKTLSPQGEQSATRLWWRVQTWRCYGGVSPEGGQT